MSGTVQTQATNLLSGIPFGYLIGAPMVAAIAARPYRLLKLAEAHA